MRAVLVTGSRKWTDGEAIWSALAGLRPTVVIHGACPTGADEDADQYAAMHSQNLRMPANWGAHGKAAGPRRNEAMVSVLAMLRDCGYECKVLAFPLGASRGTRDCMRRAMAAGFEVIELQEGEK